MRILSRIMFFMTGFAAVIALPLFIYWTATHLRYNLIQSTAIMIEEPRDARAGEPFTLRVYAGGLPIRAGVLFGGSGVAQTQNIAPLAPGWNTYVLIANKAPGLHEVTARLFAQPHGNPKTCHILSPSKSIIWPPSGICESHSLSYDRTLFQVSKNQSIP